MKKWRVGADADGDVEQKDASDAVPIDLSMNDSSSSDDESAQRFQKICFKCEEGCGYFMTFRNYKYCFPNVKKRPKAKTLFNYNGKHGVLLSMRVGDGDFRTKITKVTEDGVRNARTVIKNNP